MITEFGIGNFKAFGETQRVPLKPLTLIFGPNSSGKSSILQALLLAHHGMETGNYDVRQTKLAGDMVDLGGFANYAHKHDCSKPVKLYLETDLDLDALLTQLHGKAEEILPFVNPPCFGPVHRLELALSLAGVEPTLSAVEILLNQRPVLTFSSCPTGKYRARAMADPEGYFAVLGRWMMELARLRQASTQAGGSKSQKWEIVVDHIRQVFASGHPPNEIELAQFYGVFAQVIAEDEFSFERGRLRDPGQEDVRNWPDGNAMWQITQGYCNGLLGFFEETESAYGRDNRKLAKMLGCELPKPRPAKPPCWAEAQTVRHNFSALVEYCTSRLADAVTRMAYLGPLRCLPPRHASSEGVVDSGAFATGAAAWDEMSRNPGARAAVNNWIGLQRLDLPYVLKSVSFLDADRIRIALRGHEDKPEALVGRMADSPDWSLLVFEDVRTGTTVSHRDIGFGVSQVLPVLANAAAMRERLIAIEQPELHLHPAQQADLGDVFIESALGERRNTFLLETHSEHLILRVLRRVRETTEGKLPIGGTPVRPEDVSVVFVEPTPQGSVIRQLPVTPDGDFAVPWPGGFFAERLADLP